MQFRQFERGQRFWEGADRSTLCAKTLMASFPVVAAEGAATSVVAAAAAAGSA